MCNRIVKKYYKNGRIRVRRLYLIESNVRATNVIVANVRATNVIVANVRVTRERNVSEDMCQRD